MNQIVPLITAIIFFSFPLTWGELRIVDSGVLPLKRGDIGMVFFVSVSNTCSDTYKVKIRMIKCCETIHSDEPEDCDTIKLIGGNMGELKPDETRDLTYIFPNMYPYNRNGYCEVAVSYHYQDSEPKQLTIRIPFDTMLVKAVKAPTILKGFYNPLTIRRCASIDEDPLENCLPVNCHMKYSGQRSHYNHLKRRCEKVPKCIADPDAEMPDVVYVPAVNECRKVNSTLSEEDMKYLTGDGETSLQDKHWKISMMPHLKNMRCHHGHLNNKTGICVCDRGWGSLPIDPEMFIPTAALYHMCTIKQPCGHNAGWFSVMDIVIAAMLFLMVCASGQYYATSLTKTHSDRHSEPDQDINECGFYDSDYSVDDCDCLTEKHKRYVPPLKRVPPSMAIETNTTTTDGDRETDASQEEATSSEPSTAKTPNVDYDEDGFLLEQTPSPPGSSTTGQTTTDPDRDGSRRSFTEPDRDGSRRSFTEPDRDGPARRRNSTEQDRTGPASRRNSTEQDRTGPASRRNSTEQDRFALVSRRNGAEQDQDGTVTRRNSNEQDRAGPASRRNSTEQDRTGPVSRRNSTEQDRTGPVSRRNSTEQDRFSPATRRHSPVQYPGVAAPRRKSTVHYRDPLEMGPSTVQISRSSVPTVCIPTEEDLFLRKTSSVEAEASRSYGGLQEDMSSCDGPRYYESPRYEVGTRGSRRNADKKSSTVLSSDSRTSRSADISVDNETLQSESRSTFCAAYNYVLGEQEEEVEVEVEKGPLKNPEKNPSRSFAVKEEEEEVEIRLEKIPLKNPEVKSKQSSSPRGFSPRKTHFTIENCPRIMSSSPRQRSPAIMMGCPRQGIPMKPSFALKEDVSTRKSPRPKEDMPTTISYSPSKNVTMRKGYGPKEDVSPKKSPRPREDMPKTSSYSPSENVTIRKKVGPKENVPSKKSPRPREDMPTTSRYCPSEIVTMRKSYSPKEDISMQNRYYPSAQLPIRKSLSPKHGMPKKKGYKSREESPVPMSEVVLKGDRS